MLRGKSHEDGGNGEFASTRACHLRARSRMQTGKRDGWWHGCRRECDSRIPDESDVFGSYDTATRLYPPFSCQSSQRGFYPIELLSHDFSFFLCDIAGGAGRFLARLAPTRSACPSDTMYGDPTATIGARRCNDMPKTASRPSPLRSIPLIPGR